MLKMKKFPAWERLLRPPHSVGAIMDNWRHGYPCDIPSRDDMHIMPPLPRVDDEQLVEVDNAEDDFASPTRREEGNLFDAYDDDYWHHSYANEQCCSNLTVSGRARRQQLHHSSLVRQCRHP